jgi:hypothetical protein
MNINQQKQQVMTMRLARQELPPTKVGKPATAWGKAAPAKIRLVCGCFFA